MTGTLKDAADDVVKTAVQSFPKPEHLKEAAMSDLDLTQKTNFSAEPEHRLLAEPEGPGGRCRDRNEATRRRRA